MIGSAGWVLHGIDGVSAGDVDLLLEAADARRLCADHGFGACADTGDGPFRSDVHARYAGTGTGATLAIDIMAGFRVRAAGRWQDVRPGAPLVRDGWPVAGLADLAAMARLFDRPKDRARLALLERDDCRSNHGEVRPCRAQSRHVPRA